MRSNARIIYDFSDNIRIQCKQYIQYTYIIINMFFGNLSLFLPGDLRSCSATYRLFKRTGRNDIDLQDQLMEVTYKGE